MNYRRLLLTSSLCVGLAVPALAQTDGSGVSVIRGADPTAPTVAGVTIIRGQPAQQAQVQPRPRPTPQPQVVAAGDEFWLYDPENDRLTACNFRRGLNVGAREIRCFSRTLR